MRQLFANIGFSDKLLFWVLVFNIILQTFLLVAIYQTVNTNCQ